MRRCCHYPARSYRLSISSSDLNELPAASPSRPPTHANRAGRNASFTQFLAGAASLPNSELLRVGLKSTILGYLNAPSPVDAEGWYSTGDLVEVDGEWIRFRGRRSDLINVGGEKAAPSEVERVLLELDFIREAVVSGESNPILGHVVAASIVLAGAVDERNAMRRIRIHCRSRCVRP